LPEQVVIFTVGKEEYGMPIKVIKEICRLDAIRPVPQAPDYVLGLISLRGRALPLIDLHKRFDITAVTQNQGQTEGQDYCNRYALIAEFQDSAVAFAVDEVCAVCDLDNIMPPPPLVKVPFISGIVNLPDRIIIQLLPERILEANEVEDLEKLIC
jgi:purine-binding chemotaxis protein CheW